MVYFKAEIEVSKYWAQGWDSGTEISTVVLQADTFQGIQTAIDKFIKDKTSTSKGDFGITLNETTCRLVRKYKSSEVDLK